LFLLGDRGEVGVFIKMFLIGKNKKKGKFMMLLIQSISRSMGVRWRNKFDSKKKTLLCVELRQLMAILAKEHKGVVMNFASIVFFMVNIIRPLYHNIVLGSIPTKKNSVEIALMGMLIYNIIFLGKVVAL
jgi:hypothetical protein